MTNPLPFQPAAPATRASALRIGLTGAAAAALVAVGILAVAATAAPRSLLAASSGSSSGASSGNGQVFDVGGPGRGFAFGGVAITAINGSSLSLETSDGWTRTITVDDGTTYSKSGDSISLSDLEVGDEIRFRQTLEDDGTYSIDSIVVIPPHLSGVVTEVSGSTITLRLGDGSSGTVKVDSSTTYAVGSDDSSALSDVEVGMVLFAEGTENADGSLNASAVQAGNFGAFMGRGHGFGRDWHEDVSADATASPSAS